MARSKAISIELRPAQQAFLQRRLKSGHYDNATEVFTDALRALDERDAVYDAWLKAKVKASMANKKLGTPAEVVFEQLEARYERQVKATKRGP